MKKNNYGAEQIETLDGKVITLEQLEEAKANKAIRIIEDKNKPGSYRTLKRMVD